MSPKDWTFRILDMLIAIEQIEDFIQGYNQEDFSEDIKTFKAVERNLEIIGEANKHVPLEIKQQYPDIPWLEITNMRNVVSHAYDDIEQDVIWITITEDIPILKNVLLDIQKTHNIKRPS